MTDTTAYASCWTDGDAVTVALQSVDSPYADIIVADHTDDIHTVSIYTTIHGIVSHNEMYADRFAVCMYSDLERID
jgi:hypothetical protein